jgi:hypothetical protein
MTTMNETKAVNDALSHLSHRYAEKPESCGHCWMERDARDAETTMPFCACGRRVSECDHSRAGCQP